MSGINSIFSECEKWENTPISEIFGQNSVYVDQKIKKVIVYGATQMGKTTMIMNLIGIKSEKKTELSDALRGMASQGNSSTSTPIIYNKWNKDSFGIATGDEMHETEGTLREYLSTADFTKAVSLINEQQRSITPTNSTADSVRYYYIPKDFFEEKTGDQDLQIIDLPGFGEKNAFMYEKAEEIIQRLTNFVAGAVAVIKADKIVNLGNEYKHFLDRNHANHLAIAITHALSVDSELKRQISAKTDYFAACNTANDFENAIRQYFYDKLTDEQSGYLSKKRYPIDVFFPVEKRDEIRKLFPSVPELADAFDNILKELLKRMKNMKNTTSIDACVKKLEENEALIDSRLEEQNDALAELEREKKRIEEAVDNNSNAILNKDQEAKILNEKIANIQKEADLISKILTNLAEQNFDDAEYCIYKDILRWYISESSLFSKFEEFFLSKIQNLKTSLKKGLEEKIREIINENVSSVVSKKWWNKINALGAVNSLFFDIQLGLSNGEPKKILDKNTSNELDPVRKNLEQTNRNIVSLEEVKRIQEKRRDEVSNEITFCNDNIQQLNKRKTEMVKNKDEVVDVFVAHFSKKESDLLDRMEKESDPELTTALFLTYSAIYLNIKPYLREENNERNT